MVIGGDETSSTNMKDIGPFNEEEADTANSNGQPYTYITGIVETSDISDYPYPYIVGDESRSSIGGVNYENVQLQTNTTYAVLVRAYTTNDLVSVITSCIIVSSLLLVFCFVIATNLFLKCCMNFQLEFMECACELIQY